MAIKGGDLLHVGDRILIERAQQAGPGQVNLSPEKVYELGNYQSIGTLYDTPDLSFSVDSLDSSAALEAMLVGLKAQAVVTITGAPAGGTFTLTVTIGGVAETTAAIAFNATNTAVQTALIALNGLVAGDVVVTGSGPYTLAFGGKVAGKVVRVSANGAALTGGTSPSVAVVDVQAIDISKALPLDVVSEIKAGRSASSPFDVEGSVVTPYLTLESLSYKFGLKDKASQTASLKGDSIFYNPGSAFMETTAGTGTAGQVVTLANPAYPYKGAVIDGTKYALAVKLRSGKRLRFGTDYTEGVTGGGAAKTVSLTITDAVATTDYIDVVYASDAVAVYPQASHTVPTATRPAAIRGRDIEVFVGGTTLGDRWTSVQSVQLDWKVTLEKDEEFGNTQYVAQDFDVPTVNGNIAIKPRDYADLSAKIRKICGVTSATEVAGAIIMPPIELLIVLHSPDDGSVLKSLYIPDARIAVPGYSGQVQQKLTVTFNFESDSGVLTVYDGAKP